MFGHFIGLSVHVFMLDKLLLKKIKPFTASAKVIYHEILNLGTDGLGRKVQTQIRLLIKGQSDQGLQYMSISLHLLKALLHCDSK